MVVGSFGNVAFKVSPTQIKTVRDVKETGSASYQSHQIHLKKPKLEFVSIGLNQFTFNLRLSADLGTSPNDDRRLLFSYMKSGTVKRLIFGNVSYGKYVIKKITVSMETFDGYGNLRSVDLAVSLEEYA